MQTTLKLSEICLFLLYKLQEQQVYPYKKYYIFDIFFHSENWFFFSVPPLYISPSPPKYFFFTTQLIISPQAHYFSNKCTWKSDGFMES